VRISSSTVLILFQEHLSPTYAKTDPLSKPSLATGSTYLPTHLFTTTSLVMAVSRLISIFETLQTVPETATKHTTALRSPSRAMQDSSSFSDFCLSLQTGFTIDNNNNRRHSSSYTSMTSTPSSSVTASPSSSFRVNKRSSSSRYSSPFSSPVSPSSSHHYYSHRSPYLLRRQPSSVDLALQDERHSSATIGLGLMMMEPRPVLEVPLSIGSSHIFDGTAFEEEEKQPFVMGGIFEVMEGTC